MQFEEQEYSKRVDLAVWKRLLKFAVPYRKRLFSLIGIMALLGLIDALFPMFSRYAIDQIALPNRLDRLPYLVAVIAAVMVVQVTSVWGLIMLAGRIESGVPHDIRKVAFEKLQQMPLSYYDKTPVGWLMARLTSDVKKLGATLSWHIVDGFWSFFMILMMSIFMLALNPVMGLLVLCVVPVLVWVSLVFQKKILANFRKVRKFNSHLTSGFNEGISGAKTIKTLSIEGYMLEDFQKNSFEMKSFAIKAATVSSLYTPIILMLGSIAMGLVLWNGGGHVLGGKLGYGTMVAFISYATQFFEPVKQFARVFTELQYTQASAERVMSLLTQENELKDSDTVEAEYGAMLAHDRREDSGENWPAFHGELTFENVSFRYNDGEKVLENFNLTVRQGETIAIVGETGSGKTTIVNLACRFYEPTEGRILVDGVDYKERPLLWMYQNIGYVLQEPHLFSGSVKENILYGRQNALEEDMIKAAMLVNAHEFIMGLEKGYDSEVGERGSRLSTGQKQLISFARAILADPGMFVLDEATSSVDTETEHLIQDAMHKALRGRTSFIIAHRLSTIRTADRILVIDKGQITEAGTHQELLKRKGHYYRLYTNQYLASQKEEELAV